MADRRALQDFSLSMHRFLTESVWQSLCSESLQPTQKCEALFEHCFELLGLQCPSENTFACMVALVHLQKAWSSFEAFTALHAVKAQWRSFTKRKNKRLTRVGDEAPYQAMLPASYEELPQFMQDGFGDQRPAPCPVQECKLLDSMHAVPLRRTNTHAPSAPVAGPDRAAPEAGFAAGAAAVVTAVMQQAMRGAAPSRGELAIEYLAPGTSKSTMPSRQSSQASSQEKPLEEPRREACLALPAPLECSETDAVTAEAAPADTAEVACPESAPDLVRVPVLANTDQGSEAVRQALDAALQARDSRKTQGPAWKRPAASSAAAHAKTPARKRPAGQAEAVQRQRMKRPAAAGSSQSGRVEKRPAAAKPAAKRVVGRKLSDARHCVTSRAYHAAYNLKMAATGSEAFAKHTARLAGRRAGADWDARQ